jgi:hypothetical protein
MRRFSSVLVAAVLVAACGGEDEGLGAARDVAADADGWDTGDESASTLARVTELLLDDARSCEDPQAACAARAAAAGYTEVLALRMFSCTAPDRFAARTELVRYLDDVAALQGDDLPPSPPRPPPCRRG